KLMTSSTFCFPAERCKSSSTRISSSSRIPRCSSTWVAATYKAERCARASYARGIAGWLKHNSRILIRITFDDHPVHLSSTVFRRVRYRAIGGTDGLRRIDKFSHRSRSRQKHRFSGAANIAQAAHTRTFFAEISGEIRTSTPAWQERAGFEPVCHEN